MSARFHQLNDPDEANFESLLLRLSDSLTREELQALKVLCRDVVPRDKLQTINHGFELFQALKRLDKLSVRDRDFLASKLIALNRTDLKKQLLEIADMEDPLPKFSSLLYPSPPPPHSILKYTGTHQQSKHEDGWPRKSSASPRVLQKQYPGLQRYHPETVPVTVSTQVQPQEQAGSLRRYHPEPVPVTDSEQVSQKQPESLHHASRVTGTVETFPRQLKPEQSIQGELDVPDSAAGAMANVQVDEKLKRRLQDEGCFLDPEKYDPVKRLGHGGYARVFLVIEKDTGQRMACKMFDLTSIMDSAEKTKKLVKSLKTEVNVLSSLKHEHIVKFFRMEEEQETAILLLEYMEGGTLMDWLKQGEPLQEPLVKKFTRQLLSAVNFLHTNGTKHVIHKDIKGANILLDKPRTNIKLADFGISTIMEQLRTATGQLTSNNVASFFWTSPELLDGKTFGRNTDIWSVGCTVIEMLTTKPPLFFENLTLDQKRFRIVHCQVDPPENCNPGASEFLQRCLRPRSERPSAAELLTDPFVVDQQQ